MAVVQVLFLQPQLARVVQPLQVHNGRRGLKFRNDLQL